jgi:hypothetical protein
MGAFTNLWNSEKGLAGGLLIVAATVLVALGHLPSEAWIEYTKWIFGIFVAGKTVQGAVSTISGKSEKTEITEVTTKDQRVVSGTITTEPKEQA